jgi:hypothetical protein
MRSEHWRSGWSISVDLRDCVLAKGIVGRGEQVAT